MVSSDASARGAKSWRKRNPVARGAPLWKAQTGGRGAQRLEKRSRLHNLWGVSQPCSERGGAQGSVSGQHGKEKTMAQFQWQFDAPTGTFKQHALSTRLYEAAVQRSVMVDHCRPVEGYGKRQGENVTLTRISNIAEPTTANLVEGERIPEDSFVITTT